MRDRESPGRGEGCSQQGLPGAIVTGFATPAAHIFRPTHSKRTKNRGLGTSQISSRSSLLTRCLHRDNSRDSNRPVQGRTGHKLMPLCSWSNHAALGAAN